MLRANYKSQFDQLSKEFEGKFNVQVSSSEPSRIVDRLMHLSGDAKDPKFEARRYHLCRLIEHSLFSLKAPEFKEQIIRTINLLAEDDPSSLMRMVGITENELKAKNKDEVKDEDEDEDKDEEEIPILDLRSQTIVNVKLNEDFIFEQIAGLFLTDQFSTIFAKTEDRVSPLIGGGGIAKDIAKTDINLASIVEYVTLCHKLEENPLLLDLNIDFFCKEEKNNPKGQSIRHFFSFLETIPQKLLTTPEGINVLNMFGYDSLRLNNLDSLFLVKRYGPMLEYMSVDFIIKEHKTLKNALNDPDEMMNLLYFPEFSKFVRQTQANDFIKIYISPLTLLKELKNYQKKTLDQKDVLKAVMTSQLAANGFTDREWLALFNVIKGEFDLYQWIVNQYIETNKKNKTLEEWLITANPDIQMDLFNLLESQKIELNYFTLYRSDIFKDLPKIKGFIESQKATALDQLRTRFIFEERDEKQLEKAKNLFKKPEPELHAPEDKTIMDVETALDRYKKNYLIVDAEGHVSSGMLTPSTRADAYNQVVPHLKTRDNKLKDVLLSQEFKKHMGVKRYSLRPMTTLFQPLMPWAAQHDQEQKEKATYWEERAAICSQVKNDAVLLLELLLDIDVFNRLTSQELSILFENGNKGLFAEVIVRAYPNMELAPFEWRKNKVDMAFLRKLVPFSTDVIDLNLTNRFRAEHKIPQFIPIGAKYPGINPSDAALSEEQLYQLQDADIVAGEQILLEEFKKIIVPIHFYNIVENDAKKIKHYKKITGKEKEQKIEYIAIKYEKPSLLDEKKNLNNTSDQKVEVVEKNSSLSIYLVSTNSSTAVIIDPKKKQHPQLQNYTDFKNKIRLIAESLPLTSAGVIAGVCNVNGNHYVPYFIYRNKNGKFSVLTIDPSYKTSPELAASFADIFPGCHYVDAHIVQQVRQRDCGFNSLESIRAIAASMTSPKPILSIIDDQVYFDPKGLTVNGEPYKCLDHQHNKHYFLSEFIQQGDENRKRWAEKFRNKKQICYGADFIAEYNYDHYVREQKADDQFMQDGEFSVISNFMLQDEKKQDDNLLEIYRNQYKTKLELPSSTQLDTIRKKLLEKIGSQRLLTEDLKNTLESTAGTEAILAICKMNYKKDTAEGLMNIFINSFLSRGKIDKDSVADSLFFKFTQTDKYLEYSKILSQVERDKLQKQALVLATDKIRKEVFHLKQKYILLYIHKNIEALLKSIEIKDLKDSALIVDTIVLVLKDKQETTFDVNIITQNADDSQLLKNHIFNEIKIFIEQELKNYWNFIKENSHLLQQEKLFENGDINLERIESRMRNPLPDQKEPIAIGNNPDSIYYVLIKKQLRQKYLNQCLRLVNEGLGKYVDGILDLPIALEYVKKLDSKTQIDIVKQGDYIELFENLAKMAELPLPAYPRQNTYHGKKLHEHIQNKMKRYLHKIVGERYQDRWMNLMQTTTFSQLNDSKMADLLTLCRRKELKFSSDERREDFITLYEDDYNQEIAADAKNLASAKKQVNDFKEIMTYYMDNHLLFPARIKHYENVFQALMEREKKLTYLKLDTYRQESELLLKDINSILFDLAIELFVNPQYQKDSVEPGSYTLYVLHFLCRLLNINQPKQSLTLQEKRQLDQQISSRLSEQQPSPPLFLSDTSNLLLDKIESKKLPSTHDQPLTFQSGDYYNKILQDAKKTCNQDYLERIMVFVNTLSQFDQINSSTMHATALQPMIARFKECIAFARQTDQLVQVLHEMATSEGTMAETINTLYDWIQVQVKNKITYKGDLLVMS